MEDVELGALVRRYVEELATATQQALVAQVQLETARARIRELEAAAAESAGNQD